MRGTIRQPFPNLREWHPADAASYVHFGLELRWEGLEPMEVVELTLTLFVSSGAENILDFGFDVTIGINS